MSSLSELAQIAQIQNETQNRNHPATMIKNAILSFKGGYDNAKAEDFAQYDRLEKILKIQDAIRQAKAQQQAQAQAELESRKMRGEALDNINAKDKTTEGKFNEGLYKGINFDTPIGKVLKEALASGNNTTPLDFGTTKPTIKMDDKGVSLQYGNDLDTQYKQARIKEINAGADKKAAETKEIPNKGKSEKYSEILSQYGRLESNMKNMFTTLQKTQKEGTAEQQLEARNKYDEAQRAFYNFKPTYDAAVGEYNRRLKVGETPAEIPVVQKTEKFKPEQKSRAEKFLQDNGAPITDANIEAVIKKMGY